MTEETRRTDPFTAFLAVSCLVLAALVVALVMQNRSLKSRLEHASAAEPSAPRFHQGDVVAPIDVVEDGGGTKTIRFGEGEKRTVLLVFSSECPACRETLPVWREILKTPPDPGVRIVGIQTDRLDPNPAKQGVPAAAYPFPVYGYKRPANDPLEKVPFIPAVVVVDLKGVVSTALFGVPSKDDQARLKDALAG